MPFPTGYHDPETLALMQHALDAAWHEVELAIAQKKIDCTGLQTIMVIRIMEEVKEGVRDPERLKLAALSAINGMMGTR
jgi:hypothetical protein